MALSSSSGIWNIHSSALSWSHMQFPVSDESVLSRSHLQFLASAYFPYTFLLHIFLYTVFKILSCMLHIKGQMRQEKLKVFPPLRKHTPFTLLEAAMLEGALFFTGLGLSSPRSMVAGKKASSLSSNQRIGHHQHSQTLLFAFTSLSLPGIINQHGSCTGKSETHSQQLLL